MSQFFDVIIVGGGIAGASLGAEVAALRKTLIVEAEAHCGYHSTGRSAAFFLQSYGGPQVAELTIASGPFLDHPPADFSGRGFLHRRGAVHLSDKGWPKIPRSVAARRIARGELDRMVPGVRERWTKALFEPSCADIDVAALHAAYLRMFKRAGGQVRCDSALLDASFNGGSWSVQLAGGGRLTCAILVDAAGAWADRVAAAANVRPLGFEAKRRTMVQLRVGRSGLKDLPLIDDSAGTFYFKGEGDRTIWLSPHDEIATEPCDAAPDEIDIATAIDRFEGVVDWPVERVERSWAGLRTFAPDRLPVYGFDVRTPAFFWCAGQGGFGIQTSPAAAKLAAALLLGRPADPSLAHIDPADFSPARFA
jgi:D-arginine dehydrogenase